MEETENNNKQSNQLLSSLYLQNNSNNSNNSHNNSNKQLEKNKNERNENNNSNYSSNNSSSNSNNNNSNNNTNNSYDNENEVNRAQHFQHRKETNRICWFDPPCEPLNFNYFFSVRGQDGFHIYLWIMKDLSWVQAWYWSGLIFGTLTLTWSSFMLWRACSRKSLDEVWTHSAQFMWLFGNFLWMQGELHDNQYPNEPSIYNQRADQAGYIFIAALIWISIYYCIAKPLNITSSREVNAPYDTTGFKCRFSYFFNSWREYENVHILFWIGKDCFWCWYISYMWILFFIPTFFVAFDFCYVSLYGKNMVIDHAHYVSQLLWVSANAVWSSGEFFFSVNHDSALSMTSWNRDIRLTFRWYSAWVVVSAYIPLIILYLIWIPSTIMNRIEDDEDEGETDVEKLNTPLNSNNRKSSRLRSHSLSSSDQIQNNRNYNNNNNNNNNSHKNRKLTLFQQTVLRFRSVSDGIQLSPKSKENEDNLNTIHRSERKSIDINEESPSRKLSTEVSSNNVILTTSDYGAYSYDGDNEGKDTY